MSTLAFVERQSLERAFGMSSGYVLSFSDRTFREFVHIKGTSKANRLRAFWQIEDDPIVARLLLALLDFATGMHNADSEGIAVGRLAVDRLTNGRPVADLDALKPNASEPTFDVLARAVRESIDNGRPEEGLDRLHTFLTKYLRVLCEAHGIVASRDKPLHSLVGEYVKSLRVSGRLESTMTERIMKSAISSLQAFSDVRNDQSLAHDNQILASQEALYIFNHIASLVRFLQVLESDVKQGKTVPWHGIATPARGSAG